MLHHHAKRKTTNEQIYYFCKKVIQIFRKYSQRRRSR